jgi:glucose dehydrogenase
MRDGRDVTAMWDMRRRAEGRGAPGREGVDGRRDHQIWAGQVPAKGEGMRCMDRRCPAVGMALGAVLSLLVLAGSAADPEIDRRLRQSPGKDWLTNGGDLTNQRYSTLTQINTTNVKQLKGAWMTRLKGSGLGGKYSFEATPLVKDGIMYIITGNDDVFALNAKTGEILWEYWSGINQKISPICCGWDNRGLAMGEGMLFFGQLDTNVVALDMQTGKVV